MPTFRALVERKIPSRTRRFARFLQDFLHPRISRTKSRNIFKEFFNPSIERSGLSGKINFFLNPEPSRTGFIGFVNEFLNPAVSRRGLPGIINQFLQPLPYRIERPSSIFDEQDRKVGFMSRFLAAISDFLNPRVNFAEYIGREITVLEPSEQFAEAIDDLVDRTRERLANLAKRLDNQTITPAQFRDNVISEIRKLHIESAFLGIKGVGSITPNIIELIDQRVSRELNFFQRFFVEKVQDRFSDAQIAGARGDGSEVLRRLSQYASAGRVTGLATQQQLIEDLFGDEGQTLEMRVLGSCNNCSDCISLAGFWAPLGTLPAIGTETRCMGNCCCRKMFCTASRDGDYPDEPGIGT